MDMKHERFPLVAHAEILGTKAFQEGRPCVPALDKDLTPLFKELEVGQGKPILDAWIRNWKMTEEHAERDENITSE